jgi:hypothetical protein
VHLCFTNKQKPKSQTDNLITMQKKITGLVVIAMVMFTTIFAAPVPGNISRKAQSTFTEKFSDASNVQWTNHQNYIKASFMLNEQVMFAFFDAPESSRVWHVTS